MAPVVFRMQFDFSPKGVLAIHHLHYKWLWLGIGLAMVATVFVLSIVSVPSAVKSFMVQDKVMHMVAYATLMGWFAQIYRHDLTRAGAGARFYRHGHWHRVFARHDSHTPF